MIAANVVTRMLALDKFWSNLCQARVERKSRSAQVERNSRSARFERNSRLARVERNFRLGQVEDMLNKLQLN